MINYDKDKERILTLYTQKKKRLILNILIEHFEANFLIRENYFLGINSEV